MIKVRKIQPSFEDARGAISYLMKVETKIKTTLLITSKAGAVRANHYHKKDTHYTYLLSGKFKYSEKDMRAKISKIKSITIRPGDFVISKPWVAHAMKFIEDSTMIVFSTEPRSQTHYEKDTLRINLV